MMMEYLGELAAAERIETAVLGLQADTAYWKEPWSTASVGDAVAERL
jgi:isocitrate/isopropylmalate dehydrogenase